MTVLLEAALSYVARGYSVVPLVPRTKEPLVPWKTWQTQRPTERLVEAWWRTWPSANVGLVTGTVSGVAGLDLAEPVNRNETVGYRV